MAKTDDANINDQITSQEVRLVDQDGEMVGVMNIEEALQAAEDAGLDLVEVSPGAKPPVCKILDYGKYKYEAQKKANEAKKKQKVIQIKEIKMRPTIDTHDFEIKMRKVREFLEKGDKVKITIRFRGREMMHKDRGAARMEQIRELLAEEAKVEFHPKMEGMQMLMILSPAMSS
jgi:translation initiation factor IF-3